MLAAQEVAGDSGWTNRRRQWCTRLDPAAGRKRRGGSEGVDVSSAGSSEGMLDQTGVQNIYIAPADQMESGPSCSDEAMTKWRALQCII